MMRIKQKSLLLCTLAALFCATLAIGFTATYVSARAETQKQINITSASAVEYDNTRGFYFTVAFDNSVNMFDDTYNYVAVGGLPSYDWDWFAQSFNGNVIKDGDENTKGTSRYVIKHLNEYIGKYVFINGVSIRDIVLSYVASRINDPKISQSTYNTVYAEAWSKIVDIKTNSENCLLFYGLRVDESPFLASLLGYDAANKKLTKPLVLTIKKGYTAMDGTVLTDSIQKTFDPAGNVWRDTVTVEADDPTGHVTVGAISKPGYDAGVMSEKLWNDAVYFAAFFGDRAWYDAEVTPQFTPDEQWYWALGTPERAFEQFRTSWNTSSSKGHTPESAARAVMQKVNPSVREKIEISDADGQNSKTVGAFIDGLGNKGYEMFDVLAWHYNDILVFALSHDTQIDAFLGWNNGKIGRDFKITFKQGFTTMTNKTIAEDISFIYRADTETFERDGIVIPADPPEEDINTPVTLTMSDFHDNGISVGLGLNFSENIRPRDVGGVDVANEQWVRDGILLNDKTFGEIYDYAKAQNPALDFRVMFESRSRLTVWVDKNIPESEGGLKKTSEGGLAQSGNKVFVRGDIALPRNAHLAYEEGIAFENSGAIWMKAYVFPDREFTPVEIAGISNPSYYEDGKVKYTVTFDNDVANRQYYHVNADVSWLIAVNAGGGLNNLSEEEIKRLEYYDVLSSVLDKIVISVNGVAKTVREWQESDPNGSNYNVGVLNIHYGQDNDANGLQILWSGQRIGEGHTQFSEEQPLCPKLDAKISITFKQGFRTPDYHEIQEDVTFTYSGESGAHFVKASAGTVYETVTFTKVFYNGERIEKDGTLTLPAGIFKMDENLFTVLFAEGGGVAYTVSGADTLREGNNTVTVTGTSGSASADFTFTVVCSQKKAESSKKGCGSSAAGNLYVSALLLLCMSLSMLLIYRGKKA